MGLWTKLRRGWHLGVESVRVVVSEPELLAFPLMNVAVLAVLGVGVLVATPAVEWAVGLAGTGETVSTVLLLAGAFAVTFVTTTVSTFFAAGLVHCAAMDFRGEEPDVRDGLAAAWRARRLILVWGLVAATVSVALRVLERQGRGGRVVAALFGVSWGILTYFVVPVLALEDVTVRELFGESARTFRETWGETAGASVGVGVVFLLAVVGALGVLVLGALLLGPTPSVLAALVVAFVAFVLLLLPTAEAVTGVLKTALYLYARDGTVPQAFAGEDFAGAFPERGGDADRPGRI